MSVAIVICVLVDRLLRYGSPPVDEQDAATKKGRVNDIVDVGHPPLRLGLQNMCTCLD